MIVARRLKSALKMVLKSPVPRESDMCDLLRYQSPVNENEDPDNHSCPSDDSDRELNFPVTVQVTDTTNIPRRNSNLRLNENGQVPLPPLENCRKRKSEVAAPSDSGRAKRTCSLIAIAQKNAEESEKVQVNELKPEKTYEAFEREDGTLKFIRAPKKLSALKKISGTVFCAEVTDKFTESHSIAPKHKVKCQSEPPSEQPETPFFRKALYGCHVAPFTITDPSFADERVYLVATTGHKWIVVYICSETSKLKHIQLFSDTNNDNYYSLKFTILDEKPLLVAAGKNGVVRVVDVLKGEVDHTFHGAANTINDVQIHPQRPEIVALASKDMSVHIWNIKSQTQIAVLSSRGLEGHNDQVLTVDFNEDATRLLSAGMDHFIIIWELDGANGIQKEIELSYNKQVKNEPRPRLPVWRNFVFLKCSSVHRNYVDCAKF